MMSVLPSSECRMYRSCHHVCFISEIYNDLIDHCVMFQNVLDLSMASDVDRSVSVPTVHRATTLAVLVSALLAGAAPSATSRAPRDTTVRNASISAVVQVVRSAILRPEPASLPALLALKTPTAFSHCRVLEALGAKIANR